MRWLGVLAAPFLLTVFGTAYLLGLHALLGRAGVDRSGGWYNTLLVASLALALYWLAELTP